MAVGHKNSAAIIHILPMAGKIEVHHTTVQLEAQAVVQEQHYILVAYTKQSLSRDVFLLLTFQASTALNGSFDAVVIKIASQLHILRSLELVWQIAMEVAEPVLQHIFLQTVRKVTMIARANHNLAVHKGLTKDHYRQVVSIMQPPKANVSAKTLLEVTGHMDFLVEGFHTTKGLHTAFLEEEADFWRPNILPNLPLQRVDY